VEGRSGGAARLAHHIHTTRADWTRIVDGVVFIRTMTPSTLVNDLTM
jgi:hypothetical protein